MQQDHSSWNKLLYTTKSPATTSTSATTATASSTVSSSIPHTAVGVAKTSTATTSGTTSTATTLQSSNHRSRAPSSGPCLTSQYLRPNENLNSDIVINQPSLDPSKPSPSPPSPTSPLSTPTTQESIDAITSYQLEHEPSLSQSSIPSDAPLLPSQGKRQSDWSQYSSKPALSLRDFPNGRHNSDENRGLGISNVGFRINHASENDEYTMDIDIHSSSNPTSLKVIKMDHTQLSNQTSNATGSSIKRNLLTQVPEHDENLEHDVSGPAQSKKANGTSLHDFNTYSIQGYSLLEATSSTKDLSHNFRMSPGEICHLPSSISSGTNSSSNTISTTSSASSPSISHSPSSSSTLPSSKEESLATSHHEFNHLLSPNNSDESDDLLSPSISLLSRPVSTDVSRVPTTGSTASLSPQLSKSPQDQVAPVYSRSKSIFLPSFNSNIRPSKPKEATSAYNQLQPEQRSEHNFGDNNQSLESDSSHIIVTDVRSISFRDISTVPTLTTFGHRRSKRRNSSISYSCSPTPSVSASNSSSSTSLPSTSRRKRIKKSSHSSKSSHSIRSTSRGIPKTRRLPSPILTEHKTLESQQMESSGRMRTISESEVAVSDRSQASHRLLQRRSRQASSHQTSPEQDTEQGHNSMPDSLSSHHSLHIHHHHHHHQSSNAPQHPLQDTQLCCQESTHDRQTSGNQHQLHIQLHQDRDIHHKRQRSPPAQTTTFESSVTSPSSLSINNMERLKRARHRSSGNLDEGSYRPDDLRNGRPISWDDSKEKYVEKHSIVPSDNSETPQSTASVQIQKQQSVRIHPFDSAPTTTENRDQVPGENHLSSRNIPTIPKAPVPEKISRSESSIHPLDTDVSNGVSTTKVHDSTRDIQHTSIETEQDIKATTVDMPSKDVDSSREKAIIKHNPVDQPESEKSTSNSSNNKVALTNRSTSSSSQLSKPQPQATNLATLALPITRETLRELDLIEIFKNPQLRHDIVFDPHLQFRPNFDGERGVIKRREADRFWHEVGLELNNRRAVLNDRRETTATMLDLAGLSSSSPTSRLVQQQAQQMCPLPDAVLLPRLIDELREILLSLLPQNTSTAQDGTPSSNPEKALLISTLDPDLLIQELDHGVLDVYALFRFLGDSLKVHCAPMRDALVESMVTIVVDSDEIVRGIRMCFEILEWMKLDIANHQLRSLRPWLLDNSVDFEQKYFRDLLFRGGTINRAEEWFKHSWIKWDSVKRSVIGQIGSLDNEGSSSSKSESQRSGLQRQPSPSSDNEQATTNSSNARRRPSIIRADIGENILDGVVNEGLLDMIMRPNSSVNTMPETFELDYYRILSFHNDFQDLTILCTLLILFRQLAKNCWTQQDLVEIKKVVWLLLTDENANFGANSSSGSGTVSTGSGKTGSSSKSNVSGSQGMKDIVVQIEFAARKVRERSKNVSSTGRRSSIAPESIQLKSRGSPMTTESFDDNYSAKQPSTSSVASTLVGGLSISDTNLLTAWLDNALCKTSTLYTLIQKRLLIHFRRWLYVHSSSSMLVLSASCASLASAMSMSSSNPDTNPKGGDDEDDEDKLSNNAMKSQSNENVSKCGSEGQPSNNGAATVPAPAPAPELSHEEATKAAAEALAAKLSFNATEMEAHGLTGLEDEMSALLEKIRGVSEFNKKVYGSWYRDMVKQGRAENWLEKPNSD